ncbi:MAG: hypothetical protein HRT72_11350 [Flavobacteriales bacterium]|nr:hypothetical protein [Flavobacteriales bacterium]
MTLKSKLIRYEFLFEDDSSEVYQVELDLQNQILTNIDRVSYPEWTALELNKCENCPLSSDDYSHCPLAINISGVIEKFTRINSYSKVYLIVTIGDKEIRQRTDAQNAISSLMGLLIATSGCPHTDFLKPMAHFHFPLATEEETLFRTTGSFLLSQYFQLQNGSLDKFNFNQLKSHYNEISKVNHGISKRIRASGAHDAIINAIVLLDIFAMLFPIVIEDSLKDIEYIFKS